MGVPARLTWAVELVDPRPGDRLLEVGCGRGVAAELVLGRISPGGAYAGLDRSQTAVAAARSRVEGTPHAHLATFLCASVESDGVAALGRFDSAFAVNVNLFWTGSPEAALGVLGGVLAPGAPLWLVWEPPGPAQAERIRSAVRKGLREAGWAAEPVDGPDGLLAVRAAGPQAGRTDGL